MKLLVWSSGIVKVVMLSILPVGPAVSRPWKHGLTFVPTNFPSFRHLRVQKCRHTKSAIKSSYSNILFCFLGNVAECSNRGRWPAPLVAQFGWVSGGPGCLGPCSQLLPGWLASSRIDCPLPLVLCGCHLMWGLPPFCWDGCAEVTGMCGLRSLVHLGAAAGAVVLVPSVCLGALLQFLTLIIHLWQRHRHSHTHLLVYTHSYIIPEITQTQMDK